MDADFDDNSSMENNNDILIIVINCISIAMFTASILIMRASNDD